MSPGLRTGPVILGAPAVLMTMTTSPHEGKVLLDISVSLDGYVAGPHSDRDNPMGDGGMRLHDWIWGGRTSGVPGKGAQGVHREVFEALKRRTGAVVAGRRTYDIVDGWGGTHPFGPLPAFIVTGTPPDRVPEGATSFTFVGDPVTAVSAARTAAHGKDVYVIGGARLGTACVTRRLVDEIHLHVCPVILGGGVRLFAGAVDAPVALELLDVRAADGTTHLHYRVRK